MSLHGITKGTSFEQIAKMLAQGEASGTEMYYALARLANEQGLSEVAETVKRIIKQPPSQKLRRGFCLLQNASKKMSSCYFFWIIQFFFKFSCRLFIECHRFFIGFYYFSEFFGRIISPVYSNSNWKL